jgi:hypothetical protein
VRYGITKPPTCKAMTALAKGAMSSASRWTDEYCNFKFQQQNQSDNLMKANKLTVTMNIRVNIIKDKKLIL